MAVIQSIRTQKQRIPRQRIIRGIMLGMLAAGVMSLGLVRNALVDSLKTDGATDVAAIQTHSGGDLTVNVNADGRTHALSLLDGTGPLEVLFTSVDYDLHAVAAGLKAVPPVFVTALPADLHHLRVVDRRKDVFIRTMLPLVLAENDKIREDRRRIVAMRTDLEAGRDLSPAATAWAAGMMRRYKLRDTLIEQGVTRAAIDKLLVKVDVIPPSLAIAQAIVESGWGTSRFAREGNAIFGQWTWSASDDGMVPSGRDTGKKHRIRSFETLEESVGAYMLNLNRHYAYAGLRKRRMAMREAGDLPSGVELAGQLSRYSTKREGYVRLLRGLIRSNDLSGLDSSALAKSVTIARIDVADNGS